VIFNMLSPGNWLFGLDLRIAFVVRTKPAGGSKARAPAIVLATGRVTFSPDGADTMPKRFDEVATGNKTLQFRGPMRAHAKKALAPPGAGPSFRQKVAGFYTKQSKSPPDNWRKALGRDA
jgi:hypothetical protein